MKVHHLFAFLAIMLLGSFANAEKVTYEVTMTGVT